MIKQQRYRLASSVRPSLALIAVAIFCLFFADIEISSRTPWEELKRMLQGLLKPEFLPLDELLQATIFTISYALLAVTTAAFTGFIFSFFYHHWWLRGLCATLRSVHELFWGLLFIQWLGIHPLAGFLAIAIPYSGIFAKVFAEIIEEQKTPADVNGTGDRFSRFLYTLWPRVSPHFLHYTSYRLECGLRSSTVLGFIGLPTLGFHLEAAFMQGLYNQAAALLFIFYGLVASLRYWFQPRLIPLYLIIAVCTLSGLFWPQPELRVASLTTLISDVTPAPLRDDQPLLPWLLQLTLTEVIPGVTNTLLVTQIALVLTACLALLLFPLVSGQFFSRLARIPGQLGLIILRSTPELVITFALLLLWGPSMLPAIAALAIHNGAIVANLIGRYSNAITLRVDASRGLRRYSFEIVPRLYGQFLAFLCYRWEVILRESAILGILGVHTLGFYIDSAFESFHLDKALLLIAVTALMNMGVDQLSRRLRHRLHLRTTPSSRVPANSE